MDDDDRVSEVVFMVCSKEHGVQMLPVSKSLSVKETKALCQRLVHLCSEVGLRVEVEAIGREV